jgi:hypothetical protein
MKRLQIVSAITLALAGLITAAGVAQADGRRPVNRGPGRAA